MAVLGVTFRGVLGEFSVVDPSQMPERSTAQRFLMAAIQVLSFRSDGYEV